ncbi:MAG: dipeptidase [Croceibacterium sp.]
MRIIAAGLALVALGTPLQAKTSADVAAAALRAAPVWDGHNDVPEQLRARYQDVLGEFDFSDTRAAKPSAFGPGGMHTDLARLRRGHVGAQFWSVFVSANQPEPQAVVQTLEQIDVLKRLVARYPRDLQLAYSAADVERAMKAGRIASLIGVEGGHSIAGSLGVLRQLYALGARYMTLSHYKTLAWVDSADDVPTNHGLAPFGELVVREMNRLGMVVDLAHVNAEAMADALDVARAPVIFSHSNARALDGDSRNVPDDILQRLPANGGIVMVSAVTGFVSPALFEWNAQRAGEQARQTFLWQGQPDQVTEAMKVWDAGHPQPVATVAQMADHIDHIRTVAGIDHVGIGGDYDGIPTGPQGMEDVAGYPALFTELARRGYSQADLEKISSRNMMRVLRGVEAYAAAHRADPPIEVPVAG